MSDKITIGAILKRLLWDLQDPNERVYYGYWLVASLPGMFGNMLRSRYLCRRMKRAGSNIVILAGARFRSVENLELGNHVAIGYDCFLQAKGGLIIGNNVVLAPGVKIWSTNHDYDAADVPVQEQGHTNKPVVIGDNVFIAGNAFVLPGASIPEGCVVSAGAVVGGKPYRPFSILAGNPARVIGYRGGKAPEAEAAPVAQSAER